MAGENDPAGTGANAKWNIGEVVMNLEEEVQCGHLVTAEKKRANAVYLDLLQEFGRLCQRAGLTWWLFYGSLIGAVRHKGFIPWDDDVDIMMPRPDFDRLLRISNKDFGAQEPYFLQTPHTDPSFQQRILRFRRSDTSYITQYDLNMIAKAGGKPYNMGLALAIFPLDNVPKNKLHLAAQQQIAQMGVSFRTDKGYSKKRPVINALFKAADAIITERAIVRFMQWLYRSCRKNRTGLMQSYDGFYSQCCQWPSADFDSTIMLPFEDIEVPAPAGYDDILTATYGDYMQFPPLEERVEPHAIRMTADVPWAVSLAQLSSEASVPAI